MGNAPSVSFPTETCWGVYSWQSVVLAFQQREDGVAATYIDLSNDVRMMQEDAPKCSCIFPRHPPSQGRRTVSSEQSDQKIEALTAPEDVHH